MTGVDRRIFSAMVKKGVSAAEKKERLLNWFFESKQGGCHPPPQLPFFRPDVASSPILSPKACHAHDPPPPPPPADVQGSHYHARVRS